MAKNKYASIRYRTLDKCFRNSGKRYFIEDLIEECSNAILDLDPNSNGVSLRQVRADIAFMESEAGFSIDLERTRIGKKFWYRYIDTDFSINNIPFNETEINQLESVLKILGQFKGTPQFDAIDEIIPRLKQKIDVDTKKSNVIMEFESNEYLRGIEHLGELYNAIYYKKVLLIKYQPFLSPEAIEITLHPYFLKQFNNRWFILGFNPFNSKYNWNLALDRIVSIHELDDKYIENTEIDWSEYFSDIIGVTKPEEANIETVVLHFFGKTGHYVATKPLHESQKPAKWLDKDIMEIRLEVLLNYELEKKILSFGECVRVVKPERLAESIKNRLKMAINLYQ